MMADKASLQAKVTGRVQGVYFRAYVEGVASDLGVAGFVRNLPDGAVEVWAEGERKQLERLIGHLNVGPPHARVEKVETSWSEYTGDHSGFVITY